MVNNFGITALFVGIMMIGQQGWTQKELGVVNKVKLTQADAYFKVSDYSTALYKYEEMFRGHKDSDYLKYKIAHCHLMLKNYQLSDEFYGQIDQAKLADDKGFMYFQVIRQFYKGNYAEAKGLVDQLKEKLSDKEWEKYGLAALYKQCEYGYTAVQNPVNVKVNAMPNGVNTDFDDSHAVLSGDGKKMFFVSRRPVGKGSLASPDGGYYQNIYFSTRDEEMGWSAPEKLPSPLNSKNGHDACTGLTANGEQIFIYRNIPGRTKGGDIFVSDMGKSGRNWTLVRPFNEINSAYYDDGACLSPDGNTVYFISEREKGGHGRADIWMSQKVGGVWTKPENMGDKINTPGDESRVFIHPNGKTLFFVSNGHQEINMGGYDIFKTELGENGKWGPVENVGYPINTADDERTFVTDEQGRYAYVTTKRDGKEDYDIYEVDMEGYDIIKGESYPVVDFVGTLSDKYFGKGVSTEIQLTDLSSNESVYVTPHEQGYYEVRLKGDRNYEIAISAEGYLPYKRVVTVGGIYGVVEEQVHGIELTRHYPFDIEDDTIFEPGLLTLSSKGNPIDEKGLEYMQRYGDLMTKATNLKLRLAMNQGQLEDKSVVEKLFSQLADLGIAQNRVELVADNSEGTADASGQNITIQVIE